MSARPISNSYRVDPWEEILRRAMGLSAPDYRGRLVRSAIVSTLGAASVTQPFAEHVGAAVELFIEFGCLENRSATEDLIKTQGLVALRFRRSAEELDSASRTLDLAYLESRSEAGGAR
jgi:hypothetical protein